VSREALVLAAAAAAAGAALLIGPGRSVPMALSGSVLADRLRGIARRVRPGPAPPVAALLSALAAELAAGQPTSMALDAAASGLLPAPCPFAVAACRTGGDVPAALRMDACAPGAKALRGLASCWEVSERSGAGLSVAVARLAASIRASAEAEAQLRGEIAAVQASARLLACLPLFGLLIGQWIGAEPMSWLAGSWVGRIVLALGLALQLLGLAWLRSMVSSARAAL